MLHHIAWAPISADRRRRAHSLRPARPAGEALGAGCRRPRSTGTRLGREPRPPTDQASGTKRHVLKSALADGRPPRHTRPAHPPASSSRPENARYVSRILSVTAVRPAAGYLTLCRPCASGHTKPASLTMLRRPGHTRYVSHIFTCATAGCLGIANHSPAAWMAYAIRNAHRAAIARTDGRRLLGRLPCQAPSWRERAAGVARRMCRAGCGDRSGLAFPDAHRRRGMRSALNEIESPERMRRERGEP